MFAYTVQIYKLIICDCYNVVPIKIIVVCPRIYFVSHALLVTIRTFIYNTTDTQTQTHKDSNPHLPAICQLFQHLVGSEEAKNSIWNGLTENNAIRIHTTQNKSTFCEANTMQCGYNSTVL